MHIRSYLEASLGKEKALDFAMWAWGERFDVISLPSQEACLTWNKIHGDQLKLSEAGRVDVDLPKMIAIWEKSILR